MATFKNLVHLRGYIASEPVFRTGTTNKDDGAHLYQVVTFLFDTGRQARDLPRMQIWCKIYGRLASRAVEYNLKRFDWMDLEGKLKLWFGRSKKNIFPHNHYSITVKEWTLLEGKSSKTRKPNITAADLQVPEGLLKDFIDDDDLSD